MYKFLCLVLFITVIQAKIYEDCSGGKLSTIKDIQVQDCTATPCILKRGSKTEITINFESLTQTTTLKTKVYGILGGLKVPWTGLPADACGSVKSCPLNKNQSYEYKNAIAVLPAYPAVQVVVQFEFKTDNGEDFMCFKIPVQLK